jgi:TRAP-type C4-dicarboxylate transport system permease small subunit
LPQSINDALDWADKQLDRLAGLFVVLGSFAIVTLMGITAVSVVWRYLLRDPIFGIEDLSIIALTIVAAASVAYGARNNAHVSVDVISYFFGRRVKRFTDLFMRICVVFIAGLATYALFTKACGMEKACITNNFSIVHRPFYYVLGVAMGFYALVILVQMLKGVAHFRGEDPNEITD